MKVNSSTMWPQSSGNRTRQHCCLPLQAPLVPCNAPFPTTICFLGFFFSLWPVSDPLHTDSITLVMLPSTFLLDNQTPCILERYNVFQKDFPGWVPSLGVAMVTDAVEPPWLQVVWNPGYTCVFHPLDCAARVGDLVLSISECLGPRTVLSTEDAPLYSTWNGRKPTSVYKEWFRKKMLQKCRWGC